jgi:hypothetical protein
MTELQIAGDAQALGSFLQSYGIEEKYDTVHLKGACFRITPVWSS